MKQKTKTKTIPDLEIVRSIPSARRIFDHYMSEKNGINTQKFFTLLYIYIGIYIIVFNVSGHTITTRNKE